MTQGRVLWYSDAIGYGFIHPDEGDEKILVPHTSTDGSGPRSLKTGAKVTYEAIRGKEGMEAKNVTPWSPPWGEATTVKERNKYANLHN